MPHVSLIDARPVVAKLNVPHSEGEGLRFGPRSRC